MCVCLSGFLYTAALYAWLHEGHAIMPLDNTNSKFFRWEQEELLDSQATSAQISSVSSYKSPRRWNQVIDMVGEKCVP